jgi:hypothetical protein
MGHPLRGFGKVEPDFWIATAFAPICFVGEQIAEIPI